MNQTRLLPGAIMFVSSIVAVGLGISIRWRLLPFLKPASIVNGEQRAATVDFARFASNVFLIAGTVFCIISLVLMAATLRKRR